MSLYLCKRCQKVKHYNDFPKDKRYKLGIMSYCRTCKAELTQNWRKEQLQKNPKYYTDLYRVDPKRAIERQQTYFLRHREEVMAKRQKWRQEHPDIAKAHDKKYYAKGKITDRVKRFLYGRNGLRWDGKTKRRFGGYLQAQGVCLFCGELNPFALQNAHVFPDDDTLLISLCCTCHWLLDHYPSMINFNQELI